MRVSVVSSPLVLAAGLAVVAAACGAPSGEVAGAATEQADSLSTTSTYFAIRVDTRACVAPFCGGWFVRRLDKPNTICADGLTAAECYVARLDLSVVGAVGAADLDALRVVRGALRNERTGAFTLGAFGATEAWRDGGGSGDPTGTIYRLSDNGASCHASPCFYIHEAKLDSTTSTDLSDVTGARGDDAFSALVDGPVLVTGTNRSVAGGGKVVDVAQFYVPVASGVLDDAAGCNTPADCRLTAYTTHVETASDCACLGCPSAALDVATAKANVVAYDATCSDVAATCPKPHCLLAPAVGCQNNLCVVVPN